MTALILWIGDLAMLLLFTAIGGREHRMELTAWGTAMIALPFLIAWSTVGLVAGAFRPAAYRSAGSAARKLAYAWIAALPAALLLRLAAYGKPMFTVFAALALFFIYALLLAWRLVFTLVWNRMRRLADRSDR